MRQQSSVKNFPVILWLMMGLIILLPHRVQSNTRESVATDSHIGMPVVAAAGTANDWWNSAWDYRVPITVDANGYRRTDKPVEVALNFTNLFNNLGTSGIFAPDSLRVVEVDEVGQVLDDSLTFQFDEAADYDPSTNATGTLIFLLGGTTTANSQRTYHVYFDVAGKGFSAPAFADQVIRSDVVDENQESYQFQTNNATYFFHKFGGGFSSLVDVDGNDWLDYHETPVSGAGAYRGLPNLVPPPDGLFHPGATSATTTPMHEGPLKETLRVVTNDDQWELRVEIYPAYARITVVRKAKNYWFLYEGTPGGVLEPDSDLSVRSNGTQRLLSQSWSGDLAPPEWVYLADPDVDNASGAARAIFLVHVEDDTAVDSYRPFPSSSNALMTVFGFGRDSSTTTTYLDQVPAHFVFGLMDETAYEPAAQVINAAFQELSITVGTAQKQATSTSTPTPTSTFTSTPTNTSTSTSTNTPTSTFTSSPTALSTVTPTLTPTMIPVETVTDAPSPTVTPTATATDMLTPTPTVTPTTQPTIDAPGDVEQRLFLPLISK